MNTFSSSKHNRERGIAMFVVMFALLLLSVIGLGMMYSTNTETAINSNYKDSQIAMYASLAGLHEVRDRIQPATPNNVAPAAEPSLTAANVIYVINPRVVTQSPPGTRRPDTRTLGTMPGKSAGPDWHVWNSVYNDRFGKRVVFGQR